MTPGGHVEPGTGQPLAQTPDAGVTGLARAVRSHPVMIALVTLAALIAAGLWLSARSPTYEATAEILVTPAPDDGGPDRSLPLLRASGDRTRIVQTAASLVDSAEAETATREVLGAGWTAERVASAVDVEPVGQTDVLAVTARDSDPAVVVQLANTFAQSALDARARVLRPRFEELIGQLDAELQALPDKSSSVAVELSEQLSALRALSRTGDPTLSLSRVAQTPADVTGTAAPVILALALLAGLTVGVATAVVAELLGPARVADGTEASAVSNSPVLARLPARSPRDGRTPPGAVASALRMVQSQLDAHQPPARAVLLASPSSSADGAECVADFALTLAADDREVLVVDLDAGDRLAARLEASPAADSHGAWQHVHWSVPGVRGLRLLSAGARGPRADALAADAARLLAEAHERFDYVLVHAPPLAESGEALRVVHAVDAVVLLVRPRVTTIESLRVAVGLLERTRGRPDGLLVLSGRSPRRRRAAPETSAQRARHDRRDEVRQGIGSLEEQPDRSG